MVIESILRKISEGNVVSPAKKNLSDVTCRAEPPPVRQELPPDVLSDGRRPVELHEDGCLQLGLCPLDLLVRDGPANSDPLGYRLVDEVIELLGLPDDVRAEEAGVAGYVERGEKGMACL